MINLLTISPDLLLPIEDAQSAMIALRLEEERRQQQEQEADSDSSDDDDKKKKKKKKGKKSNTSNFSSFRNKSFVPKGKRSGQADPEAE